MAKRTLFETIVGRDFRWPRQGDKAFVATDAPLSNAYIVENETVRLALMINGYKEAADLMVARSENDRGKRDFLVFPIIFNYRQFIELSIKYQIAQFGPTVGIEANWRSHDLAYLWKQFLEVLERYGTEDPDRADQIVTEIILEFAKIDPDSYSYRYPVDTKGRPIPLTHTHLHLPTLADVMCAVESFFVGCDGYLNDLKKAGT